MFKLVNNSQIFQKSADNYNKKHVTIQDARVNETWSFCSEIRYKPKQAILKIQENTFIGGYFIKKYKNTYYMCTKRKVQSFNV